VPAIGTDVTTAVGFRPAGALDHVRTVVGALLPTVPGVAQTAVIAPRKGGPAPSVTLGSTAV
jgi:hypothetical protein